MPDKLRRFIDDARKGAAAGHQLVGWFSFRRDTPLLPSVREVAVCASLAKASVALPMAAGADVGSVFADVDLTASPRAGAGASAGAGAGAGASSSAGSDVSGVLTSPLVFMALTARRNSLSTHSMEHRLFGVLAPPMLQPVSLSVLNLAANAGAEYKSFEASSELATPSGAGPFRAILSEFGAQKLDVLVGDPAPPEVAEVERLFHCTSKQLRSVLEELETTESQLHRLRAENIKLRRFEAAATGAADSPPPPPESPPPPSP